MANPTSTHTPATQASGTSQVTEILSAAQPAALTAEARRKRYEELRTRMGRSRLEVSGKPGKHYFWAHKTDDNELTRLEIIGYAIVREPNAADVLAGKKPPQITAGGLRADGTYVIGDVILVECDEEVYEFQMLHNEEVSNSMFRSAKDTFLFEAEKVGVPTFETKGKK